MPSTSKEAKVILALEAIKNNPKIGIRAAAKLYDVPASTSAVDAVASLRDAIVQPTRASLRILKKRR